ncbi:MAG TPA: LysM peptidoglycan-binding domain-containing protein [Firmicutes bacterium]|nr:LysM peptidoglycan-binding domain-containing protein [Bacillota bacterium]
MKKGIITAVFISLLLAVSVAAGAQTSHKIQQGDTLRKIARLYDTTVLELLDLNPGITPDNLKIGAKLNLPKEPLYSYHIIQPGDNVHALAAQYRVPLDALLAVNGISNNKVVVGEMIKIPIHLYEKEVRHTVEIGDTLYKLAAQYQVTLGQLAEWNNLTDIDVIEAGQTLIVG